MAWIYLFIASVLEIVWSAGLKASDGFSKLGVSTVTIIAMIATYVFLALAMKDLPLGVAYTIWTGIGAVGSVIAGIVLFNESKDPWKLLCIALIVGGIVGLGLLTPKTASGQKEPAQLGDVQNSTSA